MLPDLFIISTARSGSSAVYSYLNQIYNNQISLKNKEPHFFLKLNKYKNRPSEIKKYYIDNKKKYLEIFKGDKLSIDASVGYFFEIDEFIKNVKKNFKKKKPKIIFLFREPNSRAKSLYLKKIITEKENSNSKFEKLLKKKYQKNSWWLNYYDNVYYYKNFLKLKDYFSNILIIDYKQVKNINKKLGIIENFLKKKVNKKNRKLKLKKLNQSKVPFIFNIKSFYNFLNNDKKIYKIIKILKYYFNLLKFRKIFSEIYNIEMQDYLKISNKEFKYFINFIKKNKISTGVYRFK
jgi:hypothetical protein